MSANDVLYLESASVNEKIYDIWYKWWCYCVVDIWRAWSHDTNDDIIVLWIIEKHDLQSHFCTDDCQIYWGSLKDLAEATEACITSMADRSRKNPLKINSSKTDLPVIWFSPSWNWNSFFYIIPLVSKVGQFYRQGYLPGLLVLPILYCWYSIDDTF